MLDNKSYERAKQLNIQVSDLVKSHFLGNYKSAFKWQWITFADIRPYTEEDPEKYIDWITTAKKWDLYVKEYEEERQLKLFFLIDTAKSMSFHTQEFSKGQIAETIAMSLAYAAHENGDQVWWATFDSQIRWYIPTSKKKLSLYSLHRILGNKSWIEYSSLDNALEKLVEYRLHDHLLCIITDDLLEEKSSYLSALMRTNEVVFINILDPFERTLTWNNETTYTEESITLVTSVWVIEQQLTNKKKQMYHEKLHKLEAFTQQEVRNWSGEYLQILTNQNPLLMLTEFFHRKRARRK